MVIKLEKGKLNGSNEFVTSKTFIFQGVNNVSDRHSAPNIKINAPGKSSEESIALNLSGLQRFIGFEFRLLNDGTSFDVSGGTESGGVITINDQYDYLKNTILSGDTGVQYQITVNDIIVTTCVIDDITLNPTFENPNYYKGSVQLTDGKNPMAVEVT